MTCRAAPPSPDDMEDAWNIDIESRYRCRYAPLLSRVSHTPLRLNGSDYDNDYDSDSEERSLSLSLSYLATRNQPEHSISHLIPSHQETSAVFGAFLEPAFPGLEETERERAITIEITISISSRQAKPGAWE